MFLRFQFPHLVYGAVASSAPVKAKLDFSAFNKVKISSLVLLVVVVLVQVVIIVIVVVDILVTVALFIVLIAW